MQDVKMQEAEMPDGPWSNVPKGGTPRLAFIRYVVTSDQPASVSLEFSVENKKEERRPFFSVLPVRFEQIPGKAMDPDSPILRVLDLAPGLEAKPRKGGRMRTKGKSADAPKVTERIAITMKNPRARRFALGKEE